MQVLLRISKMRKGVLLGSIICLGFIASSCYYDNEETLYPGSTDCNAVTTPSFATDVLPILNNRCNNCHSGVSPSAGIKLNSHTEVLKYVNDGSLLGSIKHSSGFSPMPKNGSKMSACQIGLIETWITQGALNN
jgi:hypothetical protein